MDAQWQHTNGAYSRYYSQNQMGQQSWSGVNPAGSDTKHQCQQASSVGPGTGAKHEWVNCFDDFYSDVFLNDFENVDLAKYNVVCTLEMQGGWYSVPSSTTSVYSSVINPSTYSGWNNPPTNLPTLTSDKLYLKGGLPHSLTREHFPPGAHEPPLGHLQTIGGEHPQGHLQTVAEEHPQGHLQTVAGEHPQGHLQTIAGEHPQGNLQTIAGEHPQGYPQTVTGEHPQGHLQTVAGEHPQGNLQTTTRKHPQGHLQTVAREHSQGHKQIVAVEHPQGYLQTVAEEHPQGYFQTVAGEHPQGHQQTVAGEHPLGYLQTIGREHPQGNLQTVGREHPQGYLQTIGGKHPQGHLQTVGGERPKHVSQLAQDRVVGAPQQPEEEKVFSTLGQKLNLGTRCLQNADVVFLQTSSTSKLSGLTKAGSGLPEAGSTLPSISIIINTYDEKGESTKACQFDSTENLVSDGSVGDVTSSEDRWQTTASTYVSLSSSPTSGPTSSDHVSSSSDSKDSSKHVRNREVRRAVDEPRRPKNGFIRFSIEHRQQIAVKHPRLDNREISRMLGCKWRKLSNEEKKPYEVEFEKDIQAIREVNPEWRYAPARQLVEELIEPMPSRLRPRNSLKRKKLPSLVRTYSRRQNSGKSSKTSRKKCPVVQSEMLDPAATPLSEEDPSTTWVQCDLCGKWRCLPGFIQPEALCDIWFCYFNPDNRYNSCSIKEELDPDDASAPPHLPVPPNSTCTAYSGGHVLSREPSW
ncbi:uncharacterized protein LOC124113351 isoform X1 [Haliotis rufescens]|uniref:uncharacterized protein LOC124113351 isoform X1 n=2 Tax=Haliotis rufescens TaxID=6454 RepID=UPI001EB05248|nr:uncharacterized protein LOC124113351 isoform X1 [Haliotis rufescens]